MEYPLIDPQLLANLRLVHGLFNFSVLLLFCYTARFGLQIRKARRTNAPLPLAAVKRHRKLGPIFAVLGGLGFGSGLTLAVLDTGNILKYPAHFLAGLTIVTLLFTTFLVSRKIKGQNSPQRDLHFRLGVGILCLYVVGAFLGLGVLL